MPTAQIVKPLIEILKGKAAGQVVEFDYFPEDGAAKTAPKTVLALDGKDVIASLVQIDAPRGGHKFYLAGHTPDSLRAYNRKDADLLRQEAVNQRRIAEEFVRLPVANADDIQPQVRDLIAGMRDRKAESQAFADLERLGKRAVPSIIRLMDDRHPLPTRHIELENNFPGAFERIRQYTPERVVDALGAILNQITAESFGSICNGGSERERQATVAGWRVYLYYGCPAHPAAKPTSSVSDQGK